MYEEKDEVLEYMVNKEWRNVKKLDRKKYLLGLARNIEDSDNLSKKIGSVLIFNQVIEQLLKEIIVCSIAYIKAEIWPAKIDFDFTSSNLTFGKLIENFKKIVIKENGREKLIELLDNLNCNRNRVVHKLFDIEDISDLEVQLNNFCELAEQTIELLLIYYDDISYELEDLEKCVQFEWLL